METELGLAAGLKILHLQGHFGKDSPVLASRGAEVAGLDFSAPAVAAVRALALELKLSTQFVQASVYDAQGRPGWFAPYFAGVPVIIDDPSDYADPAARLTNARHITWLHPLSTLLNALQNAGLRLDWIHEHPRMPWRMFPCLARDAVGLWIWPDRPWLPLSVSLRATRII